MTIVESVAHGRFLREQLDFGEAELLRRRGWTHGCSGPGSFWHWSKRIEGEHFQCGQSMALALEGALEFVDDDGDDLHADAPSGSKFKIGGTNGD